jgi:hypothetical protein
MDSIYFVKECKEFINRGYLEGLEAFVTANLDKNIAWEYVIEKLYIHACLKKKADLADKVLEKVSLLDPIQQIAIRQMIPYGKWLLSK